MAVLGPRSKDVCAGGSEGTRTPKPQPIFKGGRTGRIMLLTSVGAASGCRRLTPVFGAACTGIVLVDLGGSPVQAAPVHLPRIHRRIHSLWIEHVYDSSGFCGSVGVVVRGVPAAGGGVLMGWGRRRGRARAWPADSGR